MAGRRARAAFSLAALLVGALWVLIPATAASAAPSLTVTPSTGLTDGQFIVIDGAGWVPHDEIAFCEAVAVVPASAGDCAGGFAAQLPVDIAGNFDTAVDVERIITVPALGRQVDCADPATPCVIGAADVNDVVGTVTVVTLQFAPPPPPTLQPLTASDFEGNSGTKNLLVPAVIVHPNLETITAPWRTVFVPGAPGNQADPATDYTPTSGTVTFPPGTTTQSATISLNGDTLVEPDEYIVVQFGKPTNANIGGFFGLGFGLIKNDDHAVVVPGTASVDEGNVGTTDLHVPVTLSNPSTETVTAQWQTVSAPGAPGNQADPSTDYTPASGTVTFAPGQTTQDVTVSVNGDTAVEPDEYLIVQFGNATNATVGGFWGLGFGGILNDDGSPPAPG